MPGGFELLTYSHITISVLGDEAHRYDLVWCKKHTNKYTCDNDLRANLVGLQTESGYDVSTEDRGWNIGDVDDLDGSKRCTACGGELG